MGAWTRSADGSRTSDDGRFVATPAFRDARRGPSDKVRDGWDLHDTLNDTIRRVPTLTEAEKRVEAVLDDEAALSSGGPWTLSIPERSIGPVGREAWFERRSGSPVSVLLGHGRSSEQDWRAALDRLIVRSGASVRVTRSNRV